VFLKLNIAVMRPTKPRIYGIVPMMKALEPIFNGVRIIRTKQARENNFPITVKVLCFFSQPDLSNSLATTSLGKTISKRPSIKHSKHNGIHPLSHPISRAGTSSISPPFEILIK
jgi:hypothetical protein